MRRPLPQPGLVQVTVSSSVFWRHLRRVLRVSSQQQQQQRCTPCRPLAALLLAALLPSILMHQWHVTPCLES